MRHTLRWLLCASIVSVSIIPSALQAEEATIISLSEAITRALQESPRLKSATSVRLASKGVQQQSGAFPNPEVGVEAENLGGQGDYKGFDSAEITYGLTQMIELGGKRSARKQAADKDYEIAGYNYESARLDITRDVTIAYAEAVAAQEEVAIAEEQKKLASDIFDSVSRRVDAAAEPLIQRSKAEVARASADIAFNNAVRELETAKKKLSSLWGATNESYRLDSSAFFGIETPKPTQEEYLSPDIARLDAEIERARANYNLERAAVIPDPSLTVGVRDFRDTGDQAFIVGISLPIPVWDANRGNITKAREEVAVSEADRETALLERNTELVSASQELLTAYEEAESLKTTILPAAEKAFSLSRQGYQAGKFPYLEVLDAQRTLFEARSQFNKALKDYHSRRAEVERLTTLHADRKEEASVQ